MGRKLAQTAEESGIDPKDPIFDIALGRRKQSTVRLKGATLKRSRRASEEVDATVYDEERTHTEVLHRLRTTRRPSTPASFAP